MEYGILEDEPQSIEKEPVRLTRRCEFAGCGILTNTTGPSAFLA